MRRKVNLKYQMEQAIKEISKIGQSKRELRKEGKHGLHSYNEIESTLSVSANFVNWVKQQGVKNLYRLKLEHYMQYIEFKRNEGVTNGHLINIETGLRHLQKGMNAVSAKLGKPNNNWITEKRLVQSTEREKPVDRSYTAEEIKKLTEKMSPRVARAAELSYRVGFRAREVANLRVEHIQKNAEGSWDICIAKENAKGITKGGRPRIIPIPVDIQEKVQKLIAGKQPKNRIIGITSTSTLRSELSRAAKRSGISSKGWHGFRHTYARNRLAHLLENRGMSDKGYKMLNRIFENKEGGRKTDYGILTKVDKQTYDILKACIDQVHAELGHGEDRWDLAEVYMRQQLPFENPDVQDFNKK